MSDFAEIADFFNMDGSVISQYKRLSQIVRIISRVQVSTDGGATWKDARIKNPLSPYSWVIWATELDVTSKANYRIIVRATDKTRKIQTGEVREPFPNGATGYHMVNVQASR